MFRQHVQLFLAIATIPFLGSWVSAWLFVHLHPPDSSGFIDAVAVWRSMTPGGKLANLGLIWLSLVGLPATASAGAIRAAAESHLKRTPEFLGVAVEVGRRIHRVLALELLVSLGAVLVTPLVAFPMTALSLPVVDLEDRNVFAALGRGIALLKGNGKHLAIISVAALAFVVFSMIALGLVFPPTVSGWEDAMNIALRFGAIYLAATLGGIAVTLIYYGSVSGDKGQPVSVQ